MESSQQKPAQVKSNDNKNAYQQRPQTNDNKRGRDNNQRGNRGGNRGGKPQWESARLPREPRQNRQDADTEVVHISEEQMNMIKEFQKHAKKHAKVFKDQDVVEICVDHDFNEHKIKEYLATYETEAKYKGIADYEWNETKTPEQKNRERRRKLVMQIVAERLEKKMVHVRAAEAKELAEKERLAEIEREEKAGRDELKRKAKREKQAIKRAAKRDQLKAAEDNQEGKEDEVETMLAKVEAEVATPAVAEEETKEVAPEEAGDKKAKKNKKSKKAKKDKDSEPVAEIVDEAKPVVQQQVKKEEKPVAATKMQYRPKSAAAKPEEKKAEDPVRKVTFKPVEKTEKPVMKVEEAKAAPVKKERKQRDKKSVKFTEETAAPQVAAAETPKPVEVTPQMPQQNPMMAMPQMSQVMPSAEVMAGMTVEQQNIYNQQVILMQQQAFQQYHQQMMQMMMQQQQQISALATPPK